MKCSECGTAMTITRENHSYKESGLPYVTLVGIEVSRCPNCGDVEYSIPKIAKLHKAIAVALVHKQDRFTGEEVRFLRSYLGRSGADFAELVGVTASHVSRWENNHEPVSALADRFLRLLVVTTAPVRDYQVDELKRLRDEQVPARIRAEVGEGGWLAKVA